MKTNNKVSMTDKERILITILDRLSITQTLCLGGRRESQFKNGDNEYVHFGAYDDRPIEVGDLVIGQTAGVHDFKIGFVHHIQSQQEIVMREIGSNRLCNYGNEKFTRIVGLHESLLWEGDKYKFYTKVMRAFAKGDEYSYRYGGLEFHGDEAVIWIREIFGGIGTRSKPFEVRIKWNARTSVKKILQAMRDGGYGSRKFEALEEGETPAGTSHALIITR